MEIVIHIIMVAVSLCFLLKLTCLPVAGRFVLAAIIALPAFLAYDIAAEQSKTQIADWLDTPERMLDTSVWLTVDVGVQMASCFISGKSKWAKALLWFPGILIFPVVFSCMTEMIFSMPGCKFATIGIGFGMMLLVALPALSICLKFLLPEPELRMELLFMLNLIIAALGIVATVNGRTAAAGTNTINVSALAGILGLLLAGGIIGTFYHKFITNKKIKN